MLRMAFATGLLVYLTTSGAIEWAALIYLTADLPATFLALFLLFTGLIVLAGRLCILLRPHGIHLSLASSIKLTFIGVFFNSCLPGSTGGDAVKIYYAMEGNRGRRTEIATLILFDRVIGMFALLNFPLLIAALFPQLCHSISFLTELLKFSAVISGVMLFGMLLILLGNIANSKFSSQFFDWIPLGRYPKKIFDTIYSYRNNLSTLLIAVGLSFFNHAMNAGVIFIFLLVNNQSGFTWQMAILIPFGFLASALPITPGGLGVGEAAFNELFAMVSIKDGAVMLLGWRLLTLLIGLVGLVYYLQGRKRFFMTSNSPTHLK
jgi:uncharacterized protein (TIRG00374 family)